MHVYSTTKWWTEHHLHDVMISITHKCHYSSLFALCFMFPNNGHMTKTWWWRQRHQCNKAISTYRQCVYMRWKSGEDGLRDKEGTLCLQNLIFDCLIPPPRPPAPRSSSSTQRTQHPFTSPRLLTKRFDDHRPWCVAVVTAFAACRRGTPLPTHW